MSGTPQVAVQIDDEHLHGKIAEHFIHADGAFQIPACVQSFQSIDEAGFVRIIRLKFCVSKNIVIVGRII